MAPSGTATTSRSTPLAASATGSPRCTGGRIVQPTPPSAVMRAVPARPGPITRSVGKTSILVQRPDQLHPALAALLEVGRHEVRRQVGQRSHDEPALATSGGGAPAGRDRPRLLPPPRECRHRACAAPSARRAPDPRPPRVGGPWPSSWRAVSWVSSSTTRLRYRSWPDGPPIGSVSYTGDTAISPALCKLVTASRRCCQRSPRFDPSPRKARVNVDPQARRRVMRTPVVSSCWGTGGRSLRTATVTACTRSSTSTTSVSRWAKPFEQHEPLGREHPFDVGRDGARSRRCRRAHRTHPRRRDRRSRRDRPRPVGRAPALRAARRRSPTLAARAPVWHRRLGHRA